MEKTSKYAELVIKKCFSMKQSLDILAMLFSTILHPIRIKNFYNYFFGRDGILLMKCAIHTHL